MGEATPLPGAPTPEDFTSYAKRFLEQYLESYGGLKVWPGVIAREVDSASATMASVDASAIKLWDTFVDHWGDFLPAVGGSVAEILAWGLTILTGLPVARENVQGILDGSISEQDKTFLGELITKLLRNSLQVPKVAEGYLNRTPGDAEWENMAHMIGAAMRLQLGGAALKLVSKRVPKGVGLFLNSLVEVVDKSANLDDAVEEMLQPPMEMLVARGLEAYYNRLTKPADLSASEAIKARISDKIDEPTLGKILDNAGYRDDIRQILRENAAGNLTESDLNDLYQWNLLSREEVKKRYRDNAFEETDAELKTKLVEGTRRQKLREKIFELYGNLYRDGVATKQEVTPFLENYGYDADEVEMWFSVQELERRQRKWLSDTSLLKLVKKGVFTFQGAIDYVVLQGMTTADAAAYITLAAQAMQEEEVKEIEQAAKEAIKKLPKAVKDKCEDLLKPEDILTELLAQLVTLVPGELLGIPGASKLKAYIECALKEILNPAP